MTNVTVTYTLAEARVVRRALSLYREAMAKTMIDLLDNHGPEANQYGRKVSVVYEAEHATEEAIADAAAMEPC